jgi:NAD(P)-dependent dehydrogenase (short-subunit alcohol dehydrogenase family)
MAIYTGKTIVVTGASSGIGRALCLALADQRARLVLSGRDEARLEQAAEACRARGAEALAVRADVTVPAQCQLLVARAGERFGGIDVLVNNAGIGMLALFAEVRDLSVFEAVMRVNYLGAVYTTWHALPELKRSRGQIVAVASLAGLNGVPYRTGYAASKHAMIGFFDSLRIELRGTGVSVTVVAPDFVLSEIQKRAFGPDGKPLGRSPLQEHKIMTAEACAAQVVRAMEKRQRLWLGSPRGRLGRWLRLVAPGLIDRIALKAAEEGK